METTYPPRRVSMQRLLRLPLHLLGFIRVYRPGAARDTCTGLWIIRLESGSGCPQWCSLSLFQLRRPPTAAAPCLYASVFTSIDS